MTTQQPSIEEMGGSIPDLAPTMGQQIDRLSADLAQCRALLAALVDEAQREHNAMSVARNCALCDAIGESIEWLKAHPAPPDGGHDADA